MKQFTVVINEGEPLVAALEEKLRGAGIKNASIVSLVGALNGFSLITIKQDSAEIPPEHYETKFDRKAEITGNGAVKDGKAHIHVVCGTEGGPALCGHLVEGTVTYFAEIGVLVG